VYKVDKWNVTRNVTFHPCAQAAHSRGAGLGRAGSGVALLYTQTNGLTAALGAANIALYAGVYTPLKQLHFLNTWVRTCRRCAAQIHACQGAVNCEFVLAWLHRAPNCLSNKLAIYCPCAKCQPLAHNQSTPDPETFWFPETIHFLRDSLPFYFHSRIWMRIRAHVRLRVLLV